MEGMIGGRTVCIRTDGDALEIEIYWMTVDNTIVMGKSIIYNECMGILTLNAMKQLIYLLAYSP